MFSTIPFLKLFLALLVGIVLSVFFAVNIGLVWVLISFSTLLIIHLFSQRNKKAIPYFGSILFLFIVIFGIYTASLQKQKARVLNKDLQGYVVGKISKAPKHYDKHIKTNLEIVAVRSDNTLKESSGSLLLMLEKDSLALQLKQGDYISFEPNFKEIENAKNPETFNYKRYLFFHLITQQTYLKSNKWTKIETQTSFFDLQKITDLRSFLLQKYKDYGIKGDELSVLSALTLGYKNDLDYNIQKSYAASGAIHVLAVSGLHVGIVFVIINSLLKVFGRNAWGRSLRFVLSLTFIWFFALLTGGAPSVLRASLMFSFIALGAALNKKGSIYNSIFASAFLLLLYNPFLLFDLSFQLSYSAVISIVFFQPKIASLLNFNYKILKWAWDLTSVSLAAQIGTIPITIYYFHQFPNYFLLSNFIVIPLATIIIWISLLFFLSLGVSFIADGFAYILKQIIHLQNSLIQKIESWPYALSQDLYIDTIQLSLLVLVLLTLMQLLWSKKASYSLVLASFILIFFSYSNYKSYEHQAQKKLIVYNIRGFTAINFIDGNDNILLSSLKENSKQKAFHIDMNWLSLGLSNEKHIKTKQLNSKYAFSNLLKSDNPNYFSKSEFIQFYGKRILYIQNKSILEKYSHKSLSVDYIIIGKNTRIDISELNLYFNYNQLIIDSSQSERNLQFWKTQKAINPSRKVYIVSEQGAFVEDIDV